MITLTMSLPDAIELLALLSTTDEFPDVTDDLREAVDSYGEVTQ